MKYKLRKANAEVSTFVNIDLQGKKIIITKEEKENV